MFFSSVYYVEVDEHNIFYIIVIYYEDSRCLGEE